METSEKIRLLGLYIIFFINIFIRSIYVLSFGLIFGQKFWFEWVITDFKKFHFGGFSVKCRYRYQNSNNEVLFDTSQFVAQKHKDLDFKIQTPSNQFDYWVLLVSGRSLKMFTNLFLNYSLFIKSLFKCLFSLTLRIYLWFCRHNWRFQKFKLSGLQRNSEIYSLKL